jgi:DNA-binding transcriptional LysR family regulator
VTLADIAEHRLAMPDSSISAKSLYDAMFAEARILPRPAIVTNSYELMRTVSMAGLSAAIVNEHLSYRRKGATGYKYVPIKDKRVKPQRLTVCVRHGRKLPPAPSAFTEHLLQALRPLQLTGKQDS